MKDCEGRERGLVDLCYLDPPIAALLWVRFRLTAVPRPLTEPGAPRAPGELTLTAVMIHPQ